MLRPVLNFIASDPIVLSDGIYDQLNVLRYLIVHCVSKNDNDVLRYNVNAHQPILIIFGRDIAE